MDEDRLKPLDGPRDAADFLSLFHQRSPPPPYVKGEIFYLPLDGIHVTGWKVAAV